MSDQILWYATRGAGVVSLILLTVVFALGIVTSLRWQSRAWPRFVTAQLHNNIALLSVVFLVIHVVAAIVDPFVNLGWATALIPFSTTYRPLWMALGVISVDLVLALIVTSLLRNRVGFRVWRLVHWAAYAAWPMAVLHSIGTGSDSGSLWLRAVDVACICVVVGAIAWRLLSPRSRESAQPVRVLEDFR